jgi:hypothetical protein
VFDLKAPKPRPAGGTSADASGLPILPGLARYDELCGTKKLTQALRFTVKKKPPFRCAACHALRQPAQGRKPAADGHARAFEGGLRYLEVHRRCQGDHGVFDFNAYASKSPIFEGKIRSSTFQQLPGNQFESHGIQTTCETLVSGSPPTDPTQYYQPPDLRPLPDSNVLDVAVSISSVNDPRNENGKG